MLSAGRLLQRHFPAIVTIYFLKDVFAFMLHRLAHRLTNFAAENLCGLPLGDMDRWWLHMDPKFVEAFPSYQVVTGAVFLIAFPLNILLNALAHGATCQLCICEPAGEAPSSEAAATASPDSSAEGASDAAAASDSGLASSSSSSADGAATSPFAALRASVGRGLASLKQVLPRYRAIWLTDLWFNLYALPLQAVSLLLVPAYWSAPKLLGLQLALPIAVAEQGTTGRAALEESERRMKGFLAAYGWPFVALIAGARWVDGQALRCEWVSWPPGPLWTAVRGCGVEC